MEYFQQVFPRTFLNKLLQVLEQDHHGIPDERWHIIRTDKTHDFRRDDFNSVFEVAYGHRAINADILKRLHPLGPSDAGFHQIMQELRFGYFAEKFLGKVIQFYPPGRESKELDLAMGTGDEQIGVEIKSYFRPIRTPETKWTTGDEDLPIIKQSLNAAKKKFDRAKRNVIVLAGEAEERSASTWAPIGRALIGLTPYYWQHIVLQGESAEGITKFEGFFQHNCNTRVSAVAGFSCVPSLGMWYGLRIYHNPFAANRIDPRFFKSNFAGQYDVFQANYDFEAMEWVELKS